MNKLKHIFLDHRGYLLSGTVNVVLKGDTEPSRISMHPIFIDRKLLTHNTIKRSINAGNIRADNVVEVLGAKIDVSDVYGFTPDYNQLNRTLWLNKDQCLDMYLKQD